MSIHRSGSKPLIVSEAYGRKLTPTTSKTNNEDSLSDSTPYFDASAIKDFNTKPNNNNGGGSNNNGSWTDTVARRWKKFSSWTIGNRRLKMYIYSVLKFATITYVQANDVLGKASNTNNQTEKDMQMAFKVLSYLYMAILILLFTFRYVRELIAISRKKPLSIWSTHYLHAGHSVSLYLAKAQHIPKNAHPGHDQNQNHYHDAFDHHAHLYTNQSETDDEEKSDEVYDDFIGKPKEATKPTTRRHTVMAMTPPRQNIDSEILLEEPRLAFNKF
ncbi:predicted protein [Naegleria gruberi]|uniref:Predicted protein n=1 Tax=Naegleria gruberi TaxID=5762 RepID=D2W528_NAEGR|nr:uncharacterized protein NAEGRDRAFT_76516 [Naegleria gruberi]EFC35826.1 predicted protein [Naegleria gruberi]|eukprot:XP_002668570.1 predicted protein [Naegleria gruberi strain NEG-M]